MRLKVLIFTALIGMFVLGHRMGTVKEFERHEEAYETLIKCGHALETCVEFLGFDEAHVECAEDYEDGVLCT